MKEQETDGLGKNLVDNYLIGDERGEQKLKRT